MVSIIRSSHVPLYLQLKDRVRDDIDAGRFAVNEKIPTEKELEQLYGVSRTTVRQAIESLVLEGLLYKRQGIGTFVAEPKLEYALGKLTSFTDDIKRRGSEPRSKLIKLTLVVPPLRVAKQLDIPDDEVKKTNIYELIRLRFSDNEPIGIHTTYFRTSHRFTFEELASEIKNERFSLYKFFESRGLHPSEGEETIESVWANELEAELLDVPNKFPLLLVARTTFNSLKMPLEFSKMVYRADRYRYVVHLTA